MVPLLFRQCTVWVSRLLCRHLVLKLYVVLFESFNFLCNSVRVFLFLSLLDNDGLFGMFCIITFRRSDFTFLWFVWVLMYFFTFRVQFILTYVFHIILWQKTNKHWEKTGWIQLSGHVFRYRTNIFTQRLVHFIILHKILLLSCFFSPFTRYILVSYKYNNFKLTLYRFDLKMLYFIIKIIFMILYDTFVFL